MITRDEAVSLAREYVGRSRQSVQLNNPDVRRMEAERMNSLFGKCIYPSNSWIVEFPKILPPGITECPGTVMVEILEATGELREVFVGMSHEWNSTATQS